MFLFWQIHVQRRNIIKILPTPSDKKKNESSSTTYTPQELVEEVQNLTGPEGKSVIFRNLDSSGGQHFEVRLTPYGGNEFSQTTDGGDLTIKAQLPVANYWMRSHAGYVPGELDVLPPLNMNNIKEDYVVTAKTGYFQSSLPDKQSVDMSNYYDNNLDCINSSTHYFIDTAKEYFKTIKPTSMYQAFQECIYSEDNYPFLLIDTSECTTMERCFYNSHLGANSTADKVLNLSSWDTTKVSTMSYMFNKCTSLTTLDVSSFNTSNVSNMRYMFYGCSSLTTLNLSSFDTSNVSNMRYMFSGCSSLTTLNLSSFDTSNVHDMGDMFSECSSLTTLDLSSFNTSNVTDMEYMFNRCSSLTTLNLSSFNTSSVTDMDHMFYGCNSLTTLDLSSFDTSSISTMNSMFGGCTKLTEIKGVIVFHNYSSSNYYQNMFAGCPISSSTPVQIKNPPSNPNWWQIAGFTSEDQFEIVT